MDSTQDTTHKLMSLITSSKKVSPLQLGWIVGELIKREKAPGGPYVIFDDATKNRQANKAIRTFIKEMTVKQGIAQPKSDKFRKELRTRYEAARAHLRALPKSVQVTLFGVLGKIENADTEGEIGLLSTYFSSSFTTTPPPSIKQVATQLDIANIFVWMSYTLYDLAVDTRSPLAVERIPAANIALRVAQNIFLSVKRGSVALALLDQVDHAMLEETSRNKSSHKLNSKQLYRAMSNKSVAHIAGPLIIAEQLELKKLRATPST